MKSEMTEKEAREKLAQQLTGVMRAKNIHDDTWEAIKKAWGLEFVPEPKLPEQFHFREPDGHDNKWGWATDGPDGGLILFEVSDGGRENFQQQYRIDATRRACEWANAYPGLRKAAEPLVKMILGPGAWTTIQDRARDLQRELEKGPKP